MRDAVYKKGHFKVSDGHSLYYELFGNPKGKEIVYLHGGPGAGFNDKAKVLFDPEKHNVLLFDQRGAGKSTPYASLVANTSQKLIQDVIELINYVGFKKPILFGGSWGSTLALLVAIEYPERVSGLILRGIFLGTKKEINHYVRGGVGKLSPEAWQRLINLVPTKERKDIASYYLKQLTSKDKKVREKYAFEWALYESSVLKMKVSLKKLEKELKSSPNLGIAVIEAHYMVNNCFLIDNYISKNVKRLNEIPVSIVHGKFDLLCPPEVAFNLHKRLKKSKLTFTVAGHATLEPETKKALIKELQLFTN